MSGLLLLSPPTQTNIITHNTPQGSTFHIKHHIYIYAKAHFISEDYRTIYSNPITILFSKLEQIIEPHINTICMICRKNGPDNNLLSELGGGGWVGVSAKSGKMSHIVRKLRLAGGN